MKLLKITSSFLALSAVGAFTPTKPSFVSTTSLKASNNNFWLPAAASIVGWSLLSQAAFANPLINDDNMNAAFSSSATVSSEKLDFSMPTYDASTNLKRINSGFGDGVEAYLEKEADTEIDLQAQSMKKAEEARKIRIAEKKQAIRDREEDIKRRDEEKKVENMKRMKGIFD
mmetsp:Transcript_18114/g.17486  ORF Transcript_18114/g.17486 Transcript_18114/m.17486 type:complete len:172 (-) Transcript_18114:74-589(-)|eukprot:CAMPEP_0197836600 /NCGR_PEP_ID=MMETSP1437-20131217/29447_1 /TAXON_ID=49252 ORGANISM="Eucampia antarctica, Strain CCMP1452" /NCGR_SAMPLE_ID=MMETSP1437 /ASSEMBLY_ACC=CAM_ASM_001096 /LENGTH=171 /DNA_ID=CAMNT_0043442899 /DNA_START=189 /DNA_END=704 /DNA_ORIENTATION=+